MSYYVRPAPQPLPGFGFINPPDLKWTVGSDWKGEFLARCDHDSEEEAERCARELNEAYSGTMRRLA